VGLSQGLRLVVELQALGYRQLRIVPFVYEVNSWRCGVGPVSDILASHGAMAASFDARVFHNAVVPWDEAFFVGRTRAASPLALIGERGSRPSACDPWR
jgi:hypothetical protein